MSIRDWLRPPRHLLVLFFGTSMALLASLGLLGWNALKNKQVIEDSNIRQQLQPATELVANQIRQRLAVIEAGLERFSTSNETRLAEAAAPYVKSLRDDGVLVVFDVNAARAYPNGRLLYYPDSTL